MKKKKEKAIADRAFSWGFDLGQAILKRDIMAVLDSSKNEDEARDREQD